MEYQGVAILAELPVSLGQPFRICLVEIQEGQPRPRRLWHGQGQQDEPGDTAVAQHLV